jgi:tRNA-dihydrouridine synthase
MLASTGCDFVMIGRAALGNPWIFRQLLGGAEPSPSERAAVVLGHLRSHVEFVGDPTPAVRSFRKHLAWYAHGLFNASQFRAQVNQLERVSEVESAVRAFFERAEREMRPQLGEPEIDYRAALG